MLKDAPLSVLLVVGDPRDRRLARTTLEEAFPELSIQEADTRSGILAVLEGDYPDVIVSEHRLALFTGLDVIRWVRQHSVDTPIILLAGTGTEDVVIQALDKGVGDCVLKSAEHIRRLPAVVRHVLAQSRERRRAKRTTELLRQRRDLEQLVTEVLKDFVSRPPQDIDEGIKDALSSVAQFTNVDRAYALMFSPDRRTVEHVYEWCAEGVSSHAEGLEGFPVRALPLAGRIVAAGRVCYIPRVADLAMDMTADGAWEDADGICSLLNVPVVRGGAVVGLLGFDSVHHQTEWPEELVPALKGLGEVFANALDQRSLAEQLRHSALHDTLTGLPNRTFFLDQLRRSIARQKRHPEYVFAVLFMDLDQFKTVNDSLGHAAGDSLLVVVAERLKSHLRTGDTMARFGGDEFTVLLDDIKEAGDVIHFTERIQTDLNRPIELDGQQVQVTASIGIALSVTGYDEPEELVRDADTAMYRAKDAGKARYQIFDPSMHAEAIEALKLESELRRAEQNSEFCMRYQPIVSLETGRIAGFEALLRWCSAERGMVLPAQFLPAAERTGLIVPISKWVLKDVWLQCHRWEPIMQADPPLMMSVNLSAAQLLRHHLEEYIDDLLKHEALRGWQLRLEVPENVVMENADSVASMFLRLAAMYVQLSIDDFGTGYSSVRYLHTLPISSLKLGRSFVSGDEAPGHGLQVANSVMSLARSLGAKVIAVGVETKDQLRRLKQISCEYAQGNYFSAPLDAEEAQDLWLSKPKWS